MDELRLIERLRLIEALFVGVTDRVVAEVIHADSSEATVVGLVLDLVRHLLVNSEIAIPSQGSDGIWRLRSEGVVMIDEMEQSDKVRKRKRIEDEDQLESTGAVYSLVWSVEASSLAHGSPWCSSSSATCTLSHTSRG